MSNPYAATHAWQPKEVYGRLENTPKAKEMVCVTTSQGPLLIVPYKPEDGAPANCRGYLLLEDGQEVECALYRIPAEELEELHPTPENLRGRYAFVTVFDPKPTIDSINAFMEMNLMPHETNVDGEAWLTANEVDVAAAARGPMERQMAQVQATLSTLTRTVEAFTAQVGAAQTVQEAVPRRGGLHLGGRSAAGPATQEELQALQALQSELPQQRPRGVLRPGSQLPGSAMGTAGRSGTMRPLARPVQNTEATAGVNMMAAALKTALEDLKEDTNAAPGELSVGAKGLKAAEKTKEQFRANPMQKYEHVVSQAANENGHITTTNDAETMKVYFQRRVPLKHSRLGVQTFTLLNEIHSALARDDPDLAMGLIAGAYQCMEQWAIDGTPTNGFSTIAWAHTHQAAIEMGAFVAPDAPSGPMRSLPPLAQPATMAAYAASLKDLTAINKLREEEREAARNRK